MAHNHAVSDTDKHFVIDPVTMAITNQSEKLSLVQGDHNSEIFTFEIPKEVEGHDMTLCNLVEIHYCNIKHDRSETSADVYKVKDLAVSSEDNTKVTFSWLVDGNATLYYGNLSFVVKFKCVDENGVTTYVKKTPVFKSISIGESYDNGEAIEKEYSDILSEWEARLDALEQGGSVTVDQTYYPESKNAQSGTAVAKAVESKLDKNLTAYPQMDSLNENGLDINLICLFDIISKAPFTISLEKLKAVIVGDIDTALDNIIAIQNSFIGGATE